jgi:hypothetical protein
MAFDGEAFVRRFGQFGTRTISRASLTCSPTTSCSRRRSARRPGHARRGQSGGELIANMIERVPDIRWDEIRHFVCPDHAPVSATRYEAVSGARGGPGGHLDLIMSI